MERKSIERGILNHLKRTSISGILRSNGYNCSFKSCGKRYFLSPFTKESNPSLVVYPDNTFYCFSSGIGGDAIKFVSSINKCNFIDAIKYLQDSSITIIPESQIRYTVKETFDINRYITSKDYEVRSIIKYGANRAIYRGYLTGVFFNKKLGGWDRVPSLMFPHQDKKGNITGAKFRAASNEKIFSSRGKLGYYVLENILDQNPIIIIAESETSSNSLWELVKSRGINSVIISVGGVTFNPPCLPDKYSGFNKRYLIIDYDGDNDLYNERVRKFDALNAIDIKMELGKGDDINSLWVKQDERLNIILETINK